MVKLPTLLGRILCWLGFHDYRVVNVTFEFGADAVEKDECRRCGAAIPQGDILRCPTCRGPAHLTTGDEILLEQIEMEAA